MSWRTRSAYRGLSKSDRKWLKDFNRDWDTKAHGRSRTDAMDRVSGGPFQIAKVVVLQIDEEIEADITALIGEIKRFRTPTKIHNGWSINITLTDSRRVSARFKDEEDAIRAYQILKEVSAILTGL